MAEYFHLLNNIYKLMEFLEYNISENLLDLVLCDIRVFENKVRSISHRIRLNPDHSSIGRWDIRDAMIDLYRNISWIELDEDSNELEIIKNAVREYIMDE